MVEMKMLCQALRILSSGGFPYGQCWCGHKPITRTARTACVALHLGMRLDLDEGHVVYERRRQQRNGGWRNGQHQQEPQRVRLQERHVDGDVCAGGQAQESFQDADHSAPASGRFVCVRVWNLGEDFEPHLDALRSAGGDSLWIEDVSKAVLVETCVPLCFEVASGRNQSRGLIPRLGVAGGEGQEQHRWVWHLHSPHVETKRESSMRGG